MVHAQGTYANVCISPGSPCAGRIADLENQNAQLTASIANWEILVKKLRARAAELETQVAASAATEARVVELENQYEIHKKIIADIKGLLAAAPPAAPAMPNNNIPPALSCRQKEEQQCPASTFPGFETGTLKERCNRLIAEGKDPRPGTRAFGKFLFCCKRGPGMVRQWCN